MKTDVTIIGKANMNKPAIPVSTKRRCGLPNKSGFEKKRKRKTREKDSLASYLDTYRPKKSDEK